MIDRYRRTPSLLWGLLVAGALALAGCSPDTAEDTAQEGGDEIRSGDVQANSQASSDDAPEQDLNVPVQLTEVQRMNAPIAGAVDRSGQLYIAQRGGTIHAVNSSVRDPVIDISDETTTQGERGLLGIAFSANGTEFYVSYTDASGDSVLAAYEVRDHEILPHTKRTVLQVDQPYANHNGGDVQIGPDGFVYWALGDGGGSGDPLEAGQDRQTLLGSILRIDPQSESPYVVPHDNPFVDTADALPEIWAYGLRNPWRFSFDRKNGDMWIADVGQSSREEINRVSRSPSGMNFGWNLMEGTLSFTGEEPENHHPPVFEYDTSPQRCAITGGFVYRGEAIPELTGAYLFSDSCEGDIRAISVDGEGRVVDKANLGVNGGTVVSFVQDAKGELYVLDLSGSVSRLEPQE